MGVNIHTVLKVNTPLNPTKLLPEEFRRLAISELIKYLKEKPAQEITCIFPCIMGGISKEEH
jgi:hypothetical protein